MARAFASFQRGPDQKQRADGEEEIQMNAGHHNNNMTAGGETECSFQSLCIVDIFDSI